MNTHPAPRAARLASKIAATALLASLALDAVAAPPQLERASDAHITVTADNTTAAAASGGQQLEVTLPDGTHLTLSLHPQTRLMQQAARYVAAVREGNTRVYAGTVPGHPDSWVRMTRIGDAWLGAIRDGTKVWLLDPARNHATLAATIGAPSPATLVFSMDDINGLPDFGDDARPVPRVASPAPLAARLQGALAATSTYSLGVSLVLDTEFQQKYGANASSTAVGILNIVDGFYSAQANTDLSLYSLQSLSADGTLTSTDVNDLLDAFSEYSSASVPFSGLAHLLSGKDFDGGTVGLGWVGVSEPGYVPTLCDSYYGTGVDQATFSAAASAAILAHEMGHNYGADHDGDGNACASSGYIMEATTDIGNPPTSFSTCSLDYFAQYIAARQPACLAQSDLIFANGFEVTSP
jgi:hypothetical protein